VSESAVPKRLRPFLLGVRPPDRPVSRLAARRFVRDFMARTTLLTLPLYAVIFLVLEWWWAKLALGLVLLAALADLAYLTIWLRQHSPEP
jgi:hypothetical protein